GTHSRRCTPAPAPDRRAPPPPAGSSSSPASSQRRLRSLPRTPRTLRSTVSPVESTHHSHPPQTQPQNPSRPPYKRRTRLQLQPSRASTEKSLGPPFQGLVVRAYDGTTGLRKVPRSHPNTMNVLRSLGTRALPNAYVPTRSVTVHLTVPVKRRPVERTTPGPESRKPSFAERSLTVMTYVPDGTVSSGPSAIFDCREIEAESLRGGCTVTEPTVNTPLIVSAWGSQT